MNVGFIGLGKLGLPCALAVESRGHKVVGYDPSEQVKDIIDMQTMAEGKKHKKCRRSGKTFRNYFCSNTNTTW